MKKNILTITDKNGNTKDKHGNAYGFFMENEKTLCEEYCKDNDLMYKKQTITIEG